LKSNLFGTQKIASAPDYKEKISGLRDRSTKSRLLGYHPAIYHIVSVGIEEKIAYAPDCKEKIFAKKEKRSGLRDRFTKSRLLSYHPVIYHKGPFIPKSVHSLYNILNPPCYFIKVRGMLKM
jgi:hypothetical protein